MINQIELLKNKSRFRLKLIVSYIIFTLFIITSITVVHIHLSKVQNDEAFEQDVHMDASQKLGFMTQYLLQKESEIKALVESPLVMQSIVAGNYHYLSRYFMDIAKANPDYMQIRYIHQSGWEIVRIDRNTQGSSPILIAPTMLQNKADRYYFSEIMNMGKNKIWFSSLDLNEEYGKVEQPIKPVLRIGVPIYKDDFFDGIFIVNLFVKDFLAQLFSGQSYDNYLIDEEGFYLLHSISEKQWSRYFGQCTLKDDFPKYSEKILHAKKPVYFKEDHIYAIPFSIGDYRYTMIFTQKQSMIDKKKRNELQMVYPILGIVILGALIFAYILSTPFDKANKILSNEAQKLHEATINLQNKVREEVEKNERQDRILQHQSKLSALGELLSAITHQWRHPITRISLLLQNLKHMLQETSAPNDKVEKTINSSLEQIDFLSETIENFKNFYKPNEQKEWFKLNDSLNAVLMITSDILEHNGILVQSAIEENLVLYGNKISFSHVFLNIINNAKDEIIRRKIKNPQICIVARKRHNRITIFIQDNAGGVENKILYKLFEPYFSTKSKDGSGIGLYITKAIIEDKYQGTIKAKNYKNGLLFKINLYDTI